MGFKDEIISPADTAFYTQYFSIFKSTFSTTEICRGKDPDRAHYLKVAFPPSSQ